MDDGGGRRRLDINREDGNVFGGEVGGMLLAAVAGLEATLFTEEMGAALVGGAGAAGGSAAADDALAGLAGLFGFRVDGAARLVLPLALGGMGVLVEETGLGVQGDPGDDVVGAALVVLAQVLGGLLDGGSADQARDGLGADVGTVAVAGLAGL